MNNLSFGINFISGQNGISFCIKAMASERLRVGYSYDVFFGQIKPYQRGSHEVSASYYIKNQRLSKEERKIVYPDWLY
jgi:hypothetical protein